jgi:hypothetical protein
VVLAVGLLLGLGTGLAYRGAFPGSLDLGIGLMAGAIVVLYAVELRFAETALNLWDQDGGAFFHWFRVWIPLGRIVAPGIWCALLVHVLLYAAAGADRPAVAALIVVLMSGAVWRWRGIEHFAVVAAAVGLGVRLWTLHAVVDLSSPTLVLGAAMLVLTHPGGNPRWLKRSGWRQLLGWTVCYVVGCAGMLALSLWRLLPPFAATVGVLTMLTACVLWPRPLIKRQARAAAAAWGLALALVPAGAAAWSCGVMWLTGQCLLAGWLWLWLRRQKPYLIRLGRGWLGLGAAAALASGLVLTAFAVPGVPGREALGWGLWFLVPPLIDAYRSGRFPFRRSILPDNHSWADL